MAQTNIKISLAPDQVKALDVNGDKVSLDTLDILGISATPSGIADAIAYCKNAGYMATADAAPTSITTPNIANALQFFQYFVPGAVRVATQKRVADSLIGRTIGGTWSDEEVVLPIVELTGQAQPYGDKANEDLASWNLEWIRRRIVRLEAGLEVSQLEQERSAKMRQDSSALKRQAVSTAMAIALNDIAFNGFAGNTYGLLNEPSLGAYTTVATGASGQTAWSSKTFAEIAKDIRTACAALRSKSGTLVDPFVDEITLAVASDVVDYLTTPTDQYGLSVIKYLQDTFKGLRVVPVPQFNGANGGSNVFYLMASSIEGQKVAHNFIQDTLRLLGIEKLTKGFREDYAAATSGVMIPLPIGVVRYSGI